jgi:hypothetical protein
MSNKKIYITLIISIVIILGYQLIRPLDKILTMIYGCGTVSSGDIIGGGRVLSCYMAYDTLALSVLRAIFLIILFTSIVVLYKRKKKQPKQDV